MAGELHVEHFSDPGCPWAYSASPALATLHWRYGDQLDWTHVMIGLTEDAQQYVDRGYTPTGSAQGQLMFRDRYGMPFAPQPRARVTATGLACRTVVAARLLAPEFEYRVFRALQWAQFTTPVLFDTEEGVRQALDAVEHLDTDTVVSMVESAQLEDAYQADRARARTAEGSPTHFQGKSANSDGLERYTAPSLIFTRVSDGASLEVGGFQPLEAYDVAVANLGASLTRRAAPQDPADALAAFDYPLCTAEVASIMAAGLTPPDLAMAESALLVAVGEGRVAREQMGDSALWSVMNS